MSILDRYFLGLYTRSFLLTTAGILSLGLVFEGFEVMGDFSGVSVPAAAFLKYLLLLAPGYLVQAFPLGVLVATLVVLGLVSRHGELVAVQSLGGSLRRTTAVFLLAGCAVAGGEYLCAEYVVPPAARKADATKDAEILGKPSSASLIGQSFWVRTDAGELVRFTVAASDRIFDVSLFSFEEGGGFARRVEAREGRWTGTTWRLADVRVQGFDGSGPTSEPSLEFSGLDRPDRLGVLRVQPDQMNREELGQYVKRLQKAGFRADRPRVSLAGKLSHPFMNLAMGLVATGLALRYRRGGGMRAAGLSVLVAILYWGGQSLALSLGYSGRVSPGAAAWAVPVLFTLAGAILWFRAERT